ncbi:MAG: two-component regulator propeller domain-containing protein [Planctomycetaceae bacterium]
MRCEARSAWWAVVLAAALVAPWHATAVQAASSLDRTGRFAIQWWTIDDGLPEAPVNGVALAPDGTVFCTSPTRIVRFDGQAFDPVPPEVTDQVREAIGAFSNIGFDRTGLLWVQGGRGAAMLERRDERDRRWRWKVHVHSNARFNSLAFDAAGRPLLIGPNTVLMFDGRRFLEVATVTRNDRRVLWRYGDVDPSSGDLWLWGDTLRPGDIRRAAMTARKAASLEIVADPQAGGDVISLGFCAAGPLALLSDCGALRGPDGWKRLPPVLPDADYRRSGKIAATSDGTIWISSHNGILACRDGLAEQVTGGLPGFSLRTGALVADGAGGVWAACAGGLLAVRRTRLRVEPVAECRAVFERADGALVIGSPGSVGVLDPSPAASVQPLGALAAAAVPTAIVEDPTGRIWVGTQDSFIHRIEGGRVTQVTKPAAPLDELRNINALACDTAGRVWAATANGIAVHEAASDRFRTVTGDGTAAQPVAIGLLAEHDGSVLGALQSRGVERITADGRSRPVIAAADMPGRRMIVFCRDSRGDLWIGGDRGLVRHRDDAPLLRLSTETGLIEESIRQIEEDGHGRLWIATRSGHLQGMRLDDLDRLARGAVSIVRGEILGPLDGIGDTECVGHVSHAFQPDERQALLITVPVSTGVIRFDPADGVARAPTATPVVSRDTTTAYGFRFSTPGIHWSGPPLHQIRLAGVDAAWSPPTAVQRREYPSLPPGDHVFEVRAVSGETDGDFPTATLPVTVAAPWWRRPTAVALLGTAVAILAAGIAREITRRRSRRVIAALEWQRAMDRERARIARDIHDSLGAGLTRMAMMSDLARTEAAPAAGQPDRLDAIYRSARSLARSVDEIVWAVNPRNDTLAQFASYVVGDVEEFVHAGDLSLRLDVPHALPEGRPLPAHVRHHLCLAVREALQNVLRHAAATHVDFGIRVDDAAMTVRVRDDGVGFDPHRRPAAEQDGLANMRHRLLEIGGTTEVDSWPGSGTTVTFRVPLDHPPRSPLGITPEAIHDVRA